MLKINLFNKRFAILAAEHAMDRVDVLAILQHQLSMRGFLDNLCWVLWLQLNVYSLATAERLKYHQEETLVLFVEEALVHNLDGPHQVDCILACLGVNLVQCFSQEALASIVLNQEVLVAMERVFAKFNVAGHSKDELLDALAKAVLHHCVVFNVHSNVPNDGDIQDRCASFDGETLETGAHGV